MAGFDNEVLFCLGERLLPSTPQAISLMQQASTDVANVNFTGDPNGNVAANPSSLSHDPVSGNVYFKQTGTGNTGWVLFQNAVSTLNATPQFSSGVLNFGLSNLLLGNNGATITSGVANVGYGLDALDSISSADACTAVGYQALKSCDTSGNSAFGYLSLNVLTVGGQNLAVGYRSLASSVSGTANTAIGFNSLSSLGSIGNTNTALGSSSGANLLSGNGNVLIGYNSGSNYSTSESNNIIIKNSGVASESNKIRLGTQGSHDAAFMAGISGVTVASSAPIAVNSSGQLSSLGFGTSGQVLTSNGASTSPSWQNNVSNTYTLLVSTTATTYGPSDTYLLYMSNIPGVAGNEGQSKFIVPQNGTIVAMYGQVTNSLGPTPSGNATMNILINGGSPNLVSNALDFSVSTSGFGNAALSIPVTAGDVVQFQLVTPAWTPPGAGGQISATILIRT